MVADPKEMLDRVEDEASFVAFLRALSDDWFDEQRKEKAQPSPPYSRGANGWENGSIGAFLEAAVAWAEASRDGLQHYDKPDNPWKRAADVIYMGKIYE